MGGYIKCVFRNRFTLAGMALLFLGPSLYLVSRLIPEYKNVSIEIFIIIAVLGICALLVTGFGIETYGAYTRTKEILQHGHTANLSHSSMYCERVGYNLAVKEAASQ